MPGPLVDGSWLLERLGEAAMAIVDCRWRLGEPGAGERDYLAGHLPGAAFLDVDNDLSGPPGDAGRHPLPAPKDFEAAARRAGISEGSCVVGYGEGAARLWWLLRHFGHEEARVLDGGLAAWEGPLRAGPERISPGDLTARPREDDVATADEILGDPDLTLVDARASERYRGEVEPIDPVAGHIPGARNLPYEELAPDGRFLSAEQLRDRLGRDDFVAYCGSGVTSCTVVLAAELAGAGRARLYPGSWSEWSRRGLPVERQ